MITKLSILLYKILKLKVSPIPYDYVKISTLQNYYLCRSRILLCRDFYEKSFI